MTMIIFSSLLFWTDWGNSPRIEISFLDGSNRKQIVTKNLGKNSDLLDHFFSASQELCFFWGEGGHR